MVVKIHRIDFVRRVWAGVIFFLLIGSSCRAVPACPDFMVLQQPDGTRFDARVRGDEFHGWYETADGHPITQDPVTEQWTFLAEPSARQMRALQTAKVVGQTTPSGTPWTPQESKESAQLRQAADVQRAEVLATHQTQSRQRKRTPSAAPVEKKLLTLCVRFSDSPQADELTPVSYFQQKIYGVTTESALPKHTVADYYLDVSGNKLLVTGEAVGWIDLPLTKAQYGAPSPSGAKLDLRKLRILVQNSVYILGNKGFNFGPYDVDNDGFLDMLAIVFEGQGEADGGGPDTIWPHQFSYQDIWPQFSDGEPLKTGSKNAQGKDVLIDLYFTSSELNKSSADRTKLVRAPIGTFCHEFAHALGLPDLYDRTAPESSGLGNWSLMAFGAFNQADGQAGDSPAWPDPYCRLLMGWDRQINVTANMLQARIPEAKGPERAVYRLWAEGQSAPQEFLIETRKRTGFDRGLPGEGLLIYHVSINDNTEKSQNDVQWYLQPRSWTGQGHYLVALEQADGKFNLENRQGYNNDGDAMDPYSTGSEFSDTTMPSSRAYPLWGELGEGPSTHVALRNIDTSRPDASYADIYVFQDQSRPQASITSPSDMAPPVLELREATGTAFDDTAVTGIRAWLYEVGPGGRYYDWTTGSWRSDFAEEVRRRIEPGTAWTLAMPALPDGTYRLSVMAQDATGLESPLAVSQFIIDSSLLNPSLVINSPSGETYAESPLVQGSSATPENTALTARRFALYSESAARWYNWNAAAFDHAAFDFATHVNSIAASDTSWSFSLPVALGNGRYQIHGQSVNDRDRGAPWVSQSFVIRRAPSAELTSIRHQTLRQNMGSLSGTAMPQGSYLLTEIRVTIYRNGKYWNGAGWVDGGAYVTASVPPNGGVWTYAGLLPEDDGLYAVSAVAYDNQGSASSPVAGGNRGENNILFHVDAKPPSLQIDWPPVNYVSTERTIDAGDITGTAIDGSERTMVRVRLRRLEDGLFWSRYGWTSLEGESWHHGAFPGGDGNSQVRWVMEAALPDAGRDSHWCMPNGEYELAVEAQDVVGNMSTVTRQWRVDYQNPMLAGVAETYLLPNQHPVGPTAASVGSSTLAALSFVGGAGPHEAHSIFPLSGGRYGVVASAIDNSLFFGYSARQPYLFSVLSGRASWSRRLSGPVQGEGGVFYQRVGNPPVAAFGADGSAVTVSSLMQLDFGNARYNGLRQCEVTRLDSDGGERWSRLFPPTTQTQWRGGATVSALQAKHVKILPDGKTLLVCQLGAHDVRSFFGQTNFRDHVMLMLADGNGLLQWSTRYGEESEDEMLHVNESFLFFEPDGFGHVFLATKRTTATGPQQVLRKIRLSDGFTVSSFISDSCSAPETWGAMAVDATGRPIIAGAYYFDEGDVRLGVKRLSANDLIVDWESFGPAASSNYDASWNVRAEIPLLRADVHGVTVVHNTLGTNGTFGDGGDRILATRFDAAGLHLWTREVESPSAMGAPGSRADFAAVTGAGDILLTGYFGMGGAANWVRGYAKVAANGDLQFIKDLADQFDLTSLSFLWTALSADATRLVALYLNADDTQLQVRDLDNPSNMLAPPTLGTDYPADTSVVVGGTLTLQTVNTGSLADFQWYRSIADGAFELIKGATSARLVIANAGLADAGRYRAVAANSVGQSTTREAVVGVVTMAPSITRALEIEVFDDEFFFYEITANHAPSSFSIAFDPANPALGLIGNDSQGIIAGFPLSTGIFMVRISAANALGVDSRTLKITVTSRAGFSSWARDYGLTGDDARPEATPSGDGVSNLLKYAFGLDPSVAQSGPGRHLEPGVGTSGLPDVRLAVPGAAASLRVEYVRRREPSGIHYSVEFSGDLGPGGFWSPAVETPLVTPINDEWERVIVHDQVNPSQASRRFARVVVTDSR
ncbi:MAG: M6 family metalloprotease domain-containing protein [Chloroflexi bacterium]|nr:MAG: M6 family metalloprotease domain-containing protein [Chloroflexota bacterium]